MIRAKDSMVKDPLAKNPLLLCILDGWGIGDDSNPANAISKAKTPNYDRFLKEYSNSYISTSGLDVGLPDGQIGNSEVGHMTIGSGRIIFQDLPRINNAIADNNLATNSDLLSLFLDLKKNNKSCHLAGLFSNGGVHSHIYHISYIASILKKEGITTYLHIFLDGRDVAQKSAKLFIQSLSTLIDNKIVKIATISGRYYAMDRDNNIDRTNLTSNAIINAIGDKFDNENDFIQKCYDQDITDEFIKPSVNNNYDGVKDGDGLIFCNFRADRARQICEELYNSNKFSQYIAMTKYSDSLAKKYKILFPPINISNSLGEILQNNKMSQLRIAETEKYAHVTFFFSCGKEQEFINEKRILIKSPNVKTYDLKPEMSAYEITDKLIKQINENQYDFIVVNYANADMVGHSGKLDPSIKACEVIDECLAQLELVINDNNGKMLITADHGNIENMIDNNNQPHTSHTINPVPLILISNDSNISLNNGSLADIAPTILQLMNIEKPKEMTGKSLIKTND